MNDKVNEYVSKKMCDIVNSAYSVGLAQGYLEYYTACKEVIGTEKTNKSFNNLLMGDTELSSIFRDLLRLRNEDNSNDNRKHGKWFLLDECANEGVYCSCCHKKVYKTNYANQKIKSKYCPNCGAIMDEE